MAKDSHCDEQCITGTIHGGQPIGKEEHIHGLNVYVTGNRKDPQGIVVMWSDIFGLKLPNNKLIADAFGKSGKWLVYLPDFFEGDPVGLQVADAMIPVDAAHQSTFKKYTGLLASMPSFLMWMSRHTTARSDRVSTEFFEKLRLATPANTKIGIVGFCWGGRYAIRAGLESKMIEHEGKKTPLVDAVVALHPSNLVIPSDLEHLVVPVSYGWGEEDSVSKIEQKARIEDLYAKAEKSGKPMPEAEHIVYKPGRHGFAVRGNPDDPQERACLENSEAQTLKWFDRWL